MAYSLMNSSSLWDNVGVARPWAEARQAAGHDDVRTAVEGHYGAPDIMDDGLICIMFDD